MALWSFCLMLFFSLVAVEGQFIAQFYANTGFGGEAFETTITTTNITSKEVPAQIPQSFFSLRLMGSLSLPAGLYNFSCQSTEGVSSFFWIGDHIVCPQDQYTVVNFPVQDQQSYSVRLEMTFSSINQSQAGISLFYSSTNSSPMLIPIEFILPIISYPESERQALRDRQINAGWGTFANKDMLTHVKMPESFSLSLQLYDVSSNSSLTNVHVLQVGNEPIVRPGPHSWEGSYTQVYVSWNGHNISVESALDTENNLILQILPVSSFGANVLYLQLVPSFVWNRSGAIHVQDSSISVSPSGFESFTLYALGSQVQQTSLLSFDLSLPFALSENLQATISEISLLIENSKQTEVSSYQRYGELAELFQAMKTVLAWNTMYDPHEGITTPVSKGWDFGEGYVIFDWDNYFASYMLSLDEGSKDIAYSNLIQITMALTIDSDGLGFVPNYASGTIKSRDRTEPIIGSKVLWEVYRKYKDEWLVELLFDNLYLWNSWMWTHRREGPLGMVVLGSDPNPPTTGSSDINTMQGARYESGLDNSPMYDGDFFNTTTHHMMLYDVGMTSMFLMDCEALINLGNIIGRTNESLILNERLQFMMNATQQYLWNPLTGIFENKRSDTLEFYPRYSPTLFYPLLTPMLSYSQVAGMMSHLLNSSEFCVTPHPVHCSFALPSISRSDIAFGGDYWRGRIWGPMVQLVYWGLERYQGIGAVDMVRTSLVAQSRSLFLIEWRENGHVHENYDPNTGEGCNVPDSDPFYHWGALTAFISFLEEGLYY